MMRSDGAAVSVAMEPSHYSSTLANAASGSITSSLARSRAVTVMSASSTARSLQLTASFVDDKRSGRGSLLLVFDC